MVYLTNTAWNLNYNDEDTVESPYTHERVPVDHPMKYLDYATVDEAFDAFLNKYANKGITPPNELRDGAFVEWKDTLWRYNGESKKFEKYVVTPDEVGSGISKEQRIAWYEDPARIVGKTVTIQYFEETKDSKTGEYSLRFPILKYMYESERDV